MFCCWEDWVDHRREKNKPFNLSVKTQLEELAEFSEAESRESYRGNQHGWQGFVPEENHEGADDNIPSDLRYLMSKSLSSSPAFLRLRITVIGFLNYGLVS